MSIPALFLALAAATAYLVAAHRSTGNAAPAPTLWLLALALALHSGSWWLVQEQLVGIVGVTQALSLVTWLTALLLWLLHRASALQPLRVAIYPLAAAGVLLAVALPTRFGAHAPADWKIALHVALSIFAAALLTLAAAQAVALAALDRLLHNPLQLARALKRPPIEASEGWLFQLITAGFFMLSLALITGLIFVDHLFAQHLVHKTVLSITAWLIFGALLLGRRARGWRGRQAVRWALAGYATLLLAYFGSKLVLEQLLGRTWS